MSRLRLPVAMLVPLLAAPARADGTPAADFERDVLPVFREKCYACHDAKKVRAGLRLDVRGDAARGGESGKPGLVPGKPDDSEILARVVATDDTRMPPKGDPLTPKQAKALRDWIAAGAKWPDALANEGAKPRPARGCRY